MKVYFDLRIFFTIHNDLHNFFHLEYYATKCDGYHSLGNIYKSTNLDDVAFLAALPMVHEALEKIVEAFPDFQYYPPKEMNGNYYPERMTAN